MSVSSQGTEGDDDSGIGVAVSPDGRFVAFASKATNLVPGDTNGQMDVLVRDTVAGTTERVSISWAGAQGNGPSGDPGISSDGRYVTFDSFATNLAHGDGNGQEDVFMHDRATGRTVLISRDRNGVEGDGASAEPDLSPSGRFVAFDSAADNLVTMDANGARDVFVKNLATGSISLVSVAWNGEQGDRDSLNASISDDGKVVGFESLATNLVQNPDTNGATNVFVRDRPAHTTILASSDPSGHYVEADSHRASISGDGRFIALESNGPLVPAFSLIGPGFHVYLRDLSTGAIRVIDDSTGAFSDRPVVSRSGRYVLFISDGANIVPGDTNGMIDVFVRDTVTEQAFRVSVSSGGQEGNGPSGFFGGVDLSPDGMWAAFDSTATNLVEGDGNGSDDAFLHGPLGG